MTILIWLMVSAAFLAPLGLLMVRRNFAFFPGIAYGAAVWGFLILGMPLLEHPYSGEFWAVHYGALLLIAAFPVWMLLLLPTKRGEMRSVAVRAPGDIFLFCTLWLGCALGVVAYHFHLGPTPLIHVLSNDGIARIGQANDLMQLRKAATSTEDFGRIKILFYGLPPLIALFGHILYRQRSIGLVVNSISIILAMLLTVQFLHKGTLVFFVGKLFLLEMYLTGVSFRKIASLGVVALALIFGMYVFYTGHSEPRLILNILNRMFVVYVENLEFVLAMWPAQYDYFMGSTFPNPLGVFPYTPVNLAGEVMAALHGRNGNAPVASFGEGYVNFGVLGVFVVVVFIAMWLIFLAIFLAEARRNAVWLAMWITLAFDINALGRTSFFGAVDLRMIPVMMLIAISALFVNRFFKTIGRGNMYAVR